MRAPTLLWHRVDRPANWGIGLLAQGSILAGTSHPTFTSPVFRGLLVYANLLCGEQLQPPAVVPTIDDGGLVKAAIAASRVIRTLVGGRIGTQYLAALRSRLWDLLAKD